MAIDEKTSIEKFIFKKVINYKTIPNQEDFIENKLFVKGYPTHIVVNENGSIEKVVGKATELISFLENGNILTTNKDEGLPPPPGPSL